MYEPTTGRFNTLDPFFGNLNNPQSFHKYAYVHGDPINNIDPTGMVSLPQVMAAMTIGAVVTNIGATTYNGIRHRIGAKAIAWQVTENLAVFALIGAGTIFGGPAGMIVTGGLLGLGATSAFTLYHTWDDMDATDRVVAGVIFSTYLSFGITIRPAAGVPSAYENGASSPIPGSYVPKIALDMRNAPANSPKNAAGFPRNNAWFFSELLRQRPEMFSDANRIRIQTKPFRAPIIDEVWVRHNPTHQSFIGDKLVHHHILQGAYATPLPEIVHVKFSRSLHSGGSGQ